MEKDEVATIQIPIPADEQADQSSHKADEVGSSKYNENWKKDPAARKLIVMICLTYLFLVVELAVGIITGSLALVSDAFHMLSDGIALVIALLSLIYTKRKQSGKFSYGWGRSEIIGGLINGIFLISTCLYITIEAIQRFIEITVVEDPLLVVWVGLAGLGVNLIGLFMFIGDSGMHHHHGHSHGHSHGHEHGHKHKHEHEHEHKHKSEDPVSVLEEGTSKSGSDCNSPDHEHSDHEHSDNEHSDHEPKEEKKKKKASKNLRAVFLHLLGDALGSVGAILSGLAIHFFTFQERYYFDPAVSILIVALILRSSIPLVRSCITILMQTVPRTLQLDELRLELAAVSGVVKVHELHVWSLIDDKLIGSVHVLCLKEANFMKVAAKMKDIFHKYSIHSSTIQPEYVSKKKLAENKVLECRFSCNAECAPENACCPKEVEILTDADVTSILLRSGTKKDGLKQRKKHGGRTRSKSVKKEEADKVTASSPKSPKVERYDS
jgi:zinc transporter 1